MGVRFPLPAPRIQFSFSVLRGGDPELLGHSGYNIGYSAHPVYFQ
jgi:hypothetical protein